jgi:hypothetical protein
MHHRTTMRAGYDQTMRAASGSTDHITPMWLAHHFPDDYDRCVRVGRSHLCRRCLALYPLAFAAMLLTYGRTWPDTANVIALIVLPLPAVIELVLEQFGAVYYHRLRQLVVTVPLALGLGRGFAIYLADQTNRLFWSVVIGYTGLCAVSIVWRSRSDRSSL